MIWTCWMESKQVAWYKYSYHENEMMLMRMKNPCKLILDDLYFFKELIYSAVFTKLPWHFGHLIILPLTCCVWGAKFRVLVSGKSHRCTLPPPPYHPSRQGDSLIHPARDPGTTLLSVWGLLYHWEVSGVGSLIGLWSPWYRTQYRWHYWSCMVK